MKKNKLIEVKKRILALGLAGVTVVTAGCTSSENENGEPSRISISQEYSNVEDYYKYDNLSAEDSETKLLGDELTTFPEVFASPDDMLGIQRIIDDYLSK